jgi:type 1 glutamine amidotransferase
MGVIDYGARRELLVLARGHPYERDALAAVFDALRGWRWSLAEQPAAQLLVSNPACRGRFGAIVCYDMPGHDFAAADPPRAVDPDPAYRDALLALLEAGQGFVFLHHAIAAWPTWAEYARIVGGRFHYRPAQLGGRDWPDSGYRHGVRHTLSVLGAHPVTEGLPARFTMTDELYLCPVLEEDVVPLLASDYDFRDTNFYSAQLAVRGRLHCREGWSHPAGPALVGWAKHYRNSPIVYLQGGDDAAALGDPHYRRLVHNAINWVDSAEARAWVRARRQLAAEEDA